MTSSPWHNRDEIVLPGYCWHALNRAFENVYGQDHFWGHMRCIYQVIFLSFPEEQHRANGLDSSGPGPQTPYSDTPPLQFMIMLPASSLLSEEMWQ